MAANQIKDVKEAIEEVREFRGDRAPSLGYTLGKLHEHYKKNSDAIWDELKTSLTSNKFISEDKETISYLSDFFYGENPSWWPF